MLRLDVRQLAEVVALVEAATRDAAQQSKATVASLVNAGYTADSAVAFVNSSSLDQLTHTGKLSVQLQPQRSTETVDAPPPDGTPTDPPALPQPDPQSTAPSPDDHSARRADPEVTDHAPGEHSAPTRPANPVERRDLIRAQFRQVTERYLDARRQQTKKESA